VTVQRADVVVIGAGAVGLATAWQLSRLGVRRVVVVEKEADVARHQTGRNSGVLHSGIYYEPGSLKAETCRRGKLAMERLCEEEGIRFERCGKVVVATNEAELPALTRIHERARANGTTAELISSERLRAIEPNAAGVQALWVPETGIVDFVGACQALVRRIRARDGVVLCGTALTAARRTRAGILIETSRGPIEARLVVACAGLQADRVARLLGIEPAVRIIPFRGEYRLLGERGKTLVRNLIYPVPDARFPFLGVHFTRRIDGSVDCGPNAVLALGREDYGGNALDLADLAETLSYVGFLRLARKHLSYGWSEMVRSLSKRAFATALQKLVPAIEARDLEPGPSGIRAQAVTQQGALYGDFLIAEHSRVVCVLNAPSPAATASLEIGRVVAEKALLQLS
jgi:(S)-2-hydroxyglutarate dehydrogenase